MSSGSKASSSSSRGSTGSLELNGIGPDPVNGFGGAAGGFFVEPTCITVGLPTTLAPGRDQVGVIGLLAAGIPVGSVSDAVTLTIQ